MDEKSDVIGHSDDLNDELLINKRLQAQQTAHVKVLFLYNKKGEWGVGWGGGVWFI